MIPNDFLLAFDTLVNSVIVYLAIEQLRRSCAPRDLKNFCRALPYKATLVAVALCGFYSAIALTKAEPVSLRQVIMDLAFATLLWIHYFGGYKWRKYSFNFSGAHRHD